jgi:hypothetical protein
MDKAHITRTTLCVLAVAAWAFLFLVVSMWLAVLILAIAGMVLVSRKVRRPT